MNQFSHIYRIRIPRSGTILITLSKAGKKNTNTILNPKVGSTFAKHTFIEPTSGFSLVSFAAPPIVLGVIKIKSFRDLFKT